MEGETKKRKPFLWKGTDRKLWESYFRTIHNGGESTCFYWFRFCCFFFIDLRLEKKNEKGSNVVNLNDCNPFEDGEIQKGDEWNSTTKCVECIWIKLAASASSSFAKSGRRKREEGEQNSKNTEQVVSNYWLQIICLIFRQTKGEPIRTLWNSSFCIS